MGRGSLLHSFAPRSHPNLGTRSPTPPPRFFFPRNKILCANPRDSWVPKMVDLLDAGNKTLSKRHWRHLQGG